MSTQISMACFPILGRKSPGFPYLKSGQYVKNTVYIYNRKLCSGFAMAVNYRGRMKARIETKKNYPFK
jgi:hypothetical protein